jgi:hypothetical protein
MVDPVGVLDTVTPPAEAVALPPETEALGVPKPDVVDVVGNLGYAKTGWVKKCELDMRVMKRS